MAAAVVGIDPGGRWTGVVARGGPEPLFAAVLTREGDGPWPDSVFLNEVLDTVLDAIAACGPGSAPVLAVEGLRKPTGFDAGKKAALNPEGLMGVAMVYGAVLAVYPHARVVPPGKNGSAPLRAYPRLLVGGPHNPTWPRAEPRGAGVLRHARSAWDVAGAGRAIR